jgi:CubicO group peptidase (beta-lactamase class C family)
MRRALQHLPRADNLDALQAAQIWKRFQSARILIFAPFQGGRPLDPDLALVPAQAPGEHARVSMKQLDEKRLARWGATLQWHVEEGGVPGLVALVDRGGEVHVAVHGVLDLATRKPVERGSLFRISSMTKPITAVAALILIEECKLRLDDPIDPWLPELSGRRVLRQIGSALDDTVPAKRPISVRDLLTFRMGFGQMMASPGAYPILKAAHERHLGMGPPQPASMPDAEEWLRRLGELPLMHQPGESWMYNTGSDVLGVLIARASGLPLSVFLEQRIFQPLGMNDTSFSVPEDELERLATSYYDNFETGAFEVFDPVRGQWSHAPAFASGAGGLVSSIDDFHAFASMLMHHGKRGGERILSRASVELMTTDQLLRSQAATSLVPEYFEHHGWGFGVSVVTRRTTLSAPVGTYGWDGGLGTAWQSDPSERMITLLLTQRMWSSPTPPPVALDCATTAYQAIDD